MSGLCSFGDPSISGCLPMQEGAANIELVWRFARANYDMCTASEGKDDKVRSGIDCARLVVML